MRPTRLASIVPALALLVLVGEARAGAEAAPPSATAADDAPARPLPRTRTVCIDRLGARCWTEPGESACASEGARGAVPFRVVIDAPGRDDAASALAECESALRGDARRAR